MEATTLILLTEEDAATRAFLADNLAADGYEVSVADRRRRAASSAPAARPRDLRRQRRDARAARRRPRRHGFASRIDPDVPLIVLTARADELARVRYLDRGGDDVVRSRSATRSCAPGSAPCCAAAGARARGVTRVGALRIDHAARAVRVADTPVELSAKEYALLAHLAADPTRVFTKHELLRDVWGFRSPGAHPTSTATPRLRPSSPPPATAASSRTCGRRLPTDRARASGARTERGMKRAPLRRTTPLRSGARAPPADTARRRPVRPGPRSRSGNRGGRAPMAASDAQREKVVAAGASSAEQTRGITPAHLTPRSLGGCDHPDCVVPLCWMHHRANDTGRLELLPYSSRAGGSRSRTRSCTSG